MVPLPGPTVLQLAHAALGLAVESSVTENLRRVSPAIFATQQNRDEDDYQRQLQNLVELAKKRLQMPEAWYELDGRKAADAAFWWALAGVKDVELFQHLVDLTAMEVQRFGSRPSCRLKDIYQILERLAASGIFYQQPQIAVDPRAPIEKRSL